MGTGYSIKCRACSYEYTYSFGKGMLFDSLDNFIDELPAKIKKEVTEIKKSHAIIEEDFNQALYACPKCNKLYNKLSIKIKYDEGKEYFAEYQCSKCKKTLIEFEENVDVSTLSCPKCGKQEFENFGIMLWD